jgi:hypothetical protein
MRRKQRPPKANGATGFLSDIAAFCLCCATALLLLAIWTLQAEAGGGNERISREDFPKSCL